MNYRDSVISCLLLYPDLYPGRLEVDDQLFAVIGNGYEWFDGELVETSYNPDREGINELNPYDTLKKNIQLELLDSSSGLKKLIEINEICKRDNPFDLALTKKVKDILRIIDMTEKVEERYNTYCHIPDYIEQCMIKRGGNKYSWKIYEISEYSKVVTFPDNIKPCWKGALHNFITWCLSNQNYLGEDKKEQQIRYLKSSKIRLEKL